MATIKLDSLNKELNITENDQLTFSYREHVSVGYTADFEIEDNLVLEHIETDTEYKHPDRMKEGMTGGDSARTTFIFNASTKGTTLLIIRKYFRFELEAEYTFRINIS